MVIRDRNRGVLRSGLRSRDLSCQGRSEIGRHPIRDSEWDYHGRIDRPLHSHLGGQKDAEFAHDRHRLVASAPSGYRQATLLQWVIDLEKRRPIGTLSLRIPIF
jgi:hypothetical protein